MSASAPLIDFEALLTTLEQHGVRYVIIGGLAAIAHGSAYVTNDLDICYERSADNHAALVAALTPLRPMLRLSDKEFLPFPFDANTLRQGLNFTLMTDLGPLDLLGEVPGLGVYGDFVQSAVTIELFGCNLRVLSLDDLIRAKRAAARTKDLLLLQELEVLREMQKKSE